MKKALLIILVLLTLACRLTDTQSTPPATATAQSKPAWPQASTPAAGNVEQDVPYAEGENPAQRLDIYYPPESAPAPWPVMIFVHGGGWTRGDKRRVDFKDDVFTQNGYIFISVNYRLAPEATWREMAQDVASAVAWVKANIAARGGDPTRIFLMGHSAGAHLVSLVATDETYLQNVGLGLQALSGAVSLDTRAYDIPALAGADGSLPRVYAKIFGDDPRDWQEASPITHVAPGKGIPPMALAWSKGMAGDNAAAREAVARAFAEALQQAGVPVVLVDGSTKTHTEINRQFGQPGDTLTLEVLDWLASLAP